MNVLIADDEPMTRALLRRVLTRDCGCTVSEAADGLAALSSCGATPPDLIITDLRMPVMDGIALIEALRQVPALAAIPVVMMTAAREQGPVLRAIELGVTDYLLKPLQAERVADRLRSVVERITRANEASSGDRTSLLVADGNAEFRQFVAAALSPSRVVHQAQTGVAALQRAVETRPGVVLVGGDLGLLGPDLLMRKLRASGELAQTRIVAVVSKPGDTAIPDQADAIVNRTTVADDLRAQLARIAGRAVTAAGVLAAHTGLRAEVAAAAEQVFGMMLQLDVQHTFEVEPRPVAQMVVATLAIDLPDGAEVLTLALRTDVASATRIAAGIKRDGAPATSEEEAALAAAAEVLTIVAGRIKTGLESTGRSIALQPATRQLAAAGDLSDGAEGRMQVTVHTGDGGIQFVLQLTAAPVTAGPPPAEKPARVGAA
jgi:CheY-like chemotaxis protein